MRSITLKLAANGADDFAQIGDYVRVQSAAVPVRIQTGTGETDATLEQGDALNLKPFDRLRVSHTSGTEQTITLLIGDGTSADSSKVGGSVAVTSMPDVVMSNGGYLQGALAVGLASAVVLAANPARRLLMLQNNHATGNVWVNFQGVAADVATGYKLAPGDGVLLDICPPNGAIQVIGDVAHSLLIVAHA